MLRFRLLTAYCVLAMLGSLGSVGICAPRGYLDYISDALDALEQGKTRESAAALDEALVCNANDALAHTVLGLTLLTGGQPNDALAEFSAALAIDKNCSEAIHGKALVYLKKPDLGVAASLFCQAQALKPKLPMAGAIEYVKVLAGGTKDSYSDDTGDEAILALRGAALMDRKRFAEALPVWKELAAKARPLDFGERAGCTMTFVKNAPLTMTGWPITETYRHARAVKSKIPMISGEVTLKADVTKARSVCMVMFFVDGKLVGITNRSPFQYSWNTISVANGSHMIKIQGCTADSTVVTDKSTRVLVQNGDSALPSQRMYGDEADKLWRRLWEKIKLKPSLAAINYNLALCAAETGDTITAIAALERTMAADPGYLDAAQRLAGLYGANGKPAKLYRAGTDKKLIAVTFDDGPKESTTELLDILHKKGVRCTFFVVGSQVKAHPDILKRMCDDGHEIQNHTYTHRALSYLSTREMEQEVFKTAAAVRSITGRGTRFVRPPGAHGGDKFAQVIGKFGMTTVYWTTNCSKTEGTTPSKVTNHVLASAKPGGIILMHNLDRVTLAALPVIIDTLKNKGYKFATLSELVAP